MREEYIQKKLSDVTTAIGHFELLVVPFVFANALETFQSCMNILFREQLYKYVLVFFDDILVYSKNCKEHLQHLEVVLTILAD